MKHTTKTPIHVLLAVATSLALSACASVSVHQERYTANKRPKAPAKIYVRDFAGARNVFQVDRKDESLDAFRQKITDQLAKDIVRELQESTAPSERLGRERAPSGSHVWLVEGSFDRVNQGSRLLRALIGFGSGGTKLETTVRIVNWNGGKPEELLSFKTTGGSNMEPGPGALILPTDPLEVVMPFVWSAAMSGLSKDTGRTAKQIAAAVNDYLRENGVTPKNPKLKVKRLDKRKETNT